MIDKIQLIRNVGLFDSFTGSAQTAFGKLTVVYAENGRGKTTLSAMLRSIITGDPLPILERKRLSAQNAPHVVVECDGGAGPALFQNGSWSRSYPNIRIFDDCFIHENVHSGLDVTSDHRQNLHQLIIGQQGVALARRVDELTAEITRLQTELRNKGNAITASMRGPFSVDDFCVVARIDNIDESIEQTQQRVAAFQQSEKVRSTNAFEPFEPPTINLDTIQAVLARKLSGIESEANEQVKRHLHSLGQHSEAWVAQGVKFLDKSKDSCPFCSQSVSGSSLIGHYRAYFSEAYASHKESIQAQLAEVNRILGEDAFVRFNRLVSQQKERHAFWSQFTNIPPFNLDIDAITSAWQVLRGHLNRLLQNKINAPLEEIAIDEQVKQAIDNYEALRNASHALSRSLLQVNEVITKLKEEAASGSLTAASNDLQRLKAVKSRFTDAINVLCNEYLATKGLKDQAEEQKTQARAALDTHRQTMFPRYQGAINEYLRKFNAGFRIVEVQPVNPRGVISSTYQLEIDNTRVQLTQQNPGEASFKNTLSAGDRNTLALAFYFASLDQEASLGSIVAVIDDPVSSLDDGRTLTTAQEIRALLGKVAQVIVLSHSKRTLCSVWQNTDHQNCAALSVEPAPNGSTIVPWNVREEAITEYDRQHELLRNYVAGAERDIRKVAQGLRYVIEGHLRVVCTEHFPPGSVVERLTSRAKELARAGNPILAPAVLQELEAIMEYANKFHHETNRNWDVAINNINEQELKGFAQRTLAFTKK